MTSLKQYFHQQQYHPGLLGIFINPFYLVRSRLYQAMVKMKNDINGQVLDIGCGEKPYATIFKDVSSYVGMEFDSPKNRARFKNIEAWYDGQIFPFNDNSFDSIIMTQVLEHVFNPDQFLNECHRVLKKNGYILLSVPFVWDEHEQPYDYARYSSFGLAHILKKHGFEIRNHIKSLANIAVIFQLIAGYIHKKFVWIKSYKIRLIINIILISPFTLLGIILAKILPQNNDLYMDNIVLAQKIQ